MRKAHDGDMTEETLAEALRLRRERKGQTQREAAAEVGTTQTRWSTWESGAMPTLTTELVERLRAYLGLNRSRVAELILNQQLARPPRRRGGS